MSINLPISLPLDDDGYLMRICPNCDRDFKVHNGPAGERPEDAEDDPEEYACPLCGQRSDDFLTPEQHDLIQATAMQWAQGQVQNMLEDALRNSRSLEYKKGDNPADPRAVQDGPHTVGFDIIEPPCHPWEPVKVRGSEPGPFFCILCAQQYVV